VWNLGLASVPLTAFSINEPTAGSGVLAHESLRGIWSFVRGWPASGGRFLKGGDESAAKNDRMCYRSVFALQGQRRSFAFRTVELLPQNTLDMGISGDVGFLFDSSSLFFLARQ